MIWTTAMAGPCDTRSARMALEPVAAPRERIRADVCEDCVRDPVWQCDGDVDGNARVNPVDSGLVQSAFGSTDEQDLCNYDLDCNGQINPVDAGIIQSLFGRCLAPRSVCP